VTEPMSANAFSPAASVGTILLEERRRQGMSLGDVSRQLKLSVRQIEAIERDDFSWLGGAVFVHGFLRNYAKLLQLDAETLIRQADSVLKPAGAGAAPHARASVSRSAPAEKSGRLILMIGTLLVLAGGLVFWGWQPAPAPTLQPAAESVPEAAKSADPVTAKPVAQVAKPEAVSGPAESSAGTAVQPDADRTRVPANAETASGVRGPPVPKISVRMEFDDESWVEIKNRHGEIVLSRLNLPGGTVRASGEPPLSVVVGNAAGVRFFKGGEPVDLAPHTMVDVARFTLE
jgi:cytoskeleton protein RodZ